jgi:hypothetical protein
MRLFALALVLAGGISVAHATDPTRCAGVAPGQFHCKREFAAPADVFRVEGYNPSGVVVGRVVNDQGVQQVVVCSGDGCVWTPMQAGSIKAGDAVTLEGFAVGQTSWYVQLVYLL